MALSLSKFNVRLIVDALQTNALDLSTPQDEFKITKTLNFTNGADANQAHGFFHDQRTLAATTADNIDLAGSLTNAFGSTITMARVKGIMIFHGTAAASASMQVSGHATAALNTIIGVAASDLDTAQPYWITPPGGWHIAMAPNAGGYVVTATTEDMLRIYNGGAASITYDIVILYANS